MADEGGRFQSFGRKVDEKVGNATPRVEQEVQRVIRYLNEEVVPEVRRNSSAALRVASQQLGHLAEWLERGRRTGDTTEPPRWGAGQEEPKASAETSSTAPANSSSAEGTR